MTALKFTSNLYLTNDKDIQSFTGYIDNSSMMDDNSEVLFVLAGNTFSNTVTQEDANRMFNKLIEHLSMVFKRIIVIPGDNDKDLIIKLNNNSNNNTTTILYNSSYNINSRYTIVHNDENEIEALVKGQTTTISDDGLHTWIIIQYDEPNDQIALDSLEKNNKYYFIHGCVAKKTIRSPSVILSNPFKSSKESNMLSNFNYNLSKIEIKPAPPASSPPTTNNNNNNTFKQPQEKLQTSEFKVPLSIPTKKPTGIATAAAAAGIKRKLEEDYSNDFIDDDDFKDDNSNSNNNNNGSKVLNSMLTDVFNDNTKDDTQKANDLINKLLSSSASNQLDELNDQKKSRFFKNNNNNNNNANTTNKPTTTTTTTKKRRKD